MNKKRILSTVLAAALTLGTTMTFAQADDLPASALPETELLAEETMEVYAAAAVETDEKYPDVGFTLSSDGKSYTAGPASKYMTETVITIPASFKGKPVASISGFSGSNSFDEVIIEGSPDIADYAFSDCKFLKSVTFKSGSKTKKIGNYAFSGCLVLNSINIPDSLTYLGNKVFKKCEKLKEFTVRGSVELASGAFADSCFEKITILDGIKTIPSWCFQNCASLKTLVIPNSVTAFSEGSFSGCSVLTGFEIPKGVTSIPANCFSGCAAIDKADLKNITSLGEWAFQGCTSIKSVTIHSGIKNVPSHAFSGSGIESLIVEKGVEKIGASAFEKCQSLKTINVAAQNIGDDAFYRCGNLVDVTLTDDVFALDQRTFEACSSIPHIRIPKFVKTIPYYCFWGCSSLEYMIISDRLESFVGDSMMYCSKLSDIYYAGDEEAWKNVNLGAWNETLKSATVHYNSTGPTGVKINVTVKTADSKVDTTLQSVKVTGNGVNTTLTIKDGLLDVSSLKSGTYTFTFSAKNCAPRAYNNITVSNGTLTGLSKVELNLYGDMDGDGVIELTDVMDAYLTLRKPQSKSEYLRVVADANQKGGLNISDVMDIFLHLRGKSSLWK